jgi:hypothetical protein
MARGVQRADAQGPELQLPAVVERLVRVLGRGLAVHVDPRARGRHQAAVTRDVVRVVVRLEHVLDADAEIAREAQVLVDVQPRVDDGGDARVLVADQIARATEVVVGDLAEDHVRSLWATGQPSGGSQVPPLVPMTPRRTEMKKLLVAAVLSAVAIAPATASAADPSPADSKNAAKYCKALRDAAGSTTFVTMFGTKKNAYGKCVSSTAKKTAAEDAAQEKTAKSQAVEECRAVKTKGSKNAFGKCVSAKAKAKKAAADKEDEAQEDDRLNAAKTCKKAKQEDAAGFAENFGTKKNAFGKCVSTTAKQLAAERKAEKETATA